MSPHRPHERGFAIPELFLAIALMLGIAFATLAVVQQMIRALEVRSDSQAGTLALEHELERIRNDAATAYAVFVPAKDIFGGANAPHHGDVGHEVDFYGKTDTGQETYWAYEYDETHSTLQRYDYDARGNIGVADRGTGRIGTGAYPVVSHVRSFVARSLFASELTSSASDYGSLLAHLAAGAGASPEPDPVGFVPNAGPRDDLYGGNTTVQLSVASDRGTRTIHLATSAMPSGFTLHEKPAIRVVVYRRNTIHRFWFGLAQKTLAHIYDQLQYSYHPKTDPPNKWKTWCDYEIYGANINGISLHDPHGTQDYHPYDWNETAAAVYYTVTHGGYANLAPVGCSEQLPKPNETFVPAPQPSSPDVIDTPPPCFVAGQCWPVNAPPNWTPPSPWPASSPPPDWCASHAASGLCGGPGGTPPPATNASPPSVVIETVSPSKSAAPSSRGAAAPSL